MSKTLEQILGKYREDLSELPESGAGITPNWQNSENETKEQIKDLFLELVGEDEEPGRTFGPGIPGFQRDQLRQELRDKINQL